LAFAIDIGYLQMARVQLQQAADAAALAACSELVDNEAILGSPDLTDEVASARNYAVTYAALNKVCQQGPVVDPNTSNNPSGEVIIGNLGNPSNPLEPISFTTPNRYNAVQVHVHRSATQNGEVPFFFARVLGLTSQSMDAKATAALINNFVGFKAPSQPGTNLNILPYALDKQTWDALLAGSAGADQYKFVPGATPEVTAGSDSVKEVNLFPQGTGSPGNRGTVDIGSSNNSTADIARQIVHGINAADLAALGGQLKLNDSGKLYLNGDTGISAGVKDELASIIGKPRIIPLFDSVSGPGNNATYTIVGFAGVRVTAVKLTGSMSSKYVMIQPAAVNAVGGIPGAGTQTSYYMYSDPWLVR
jgi:Flp pilus assembly protein TadG